MTCRDVLKSRKSKGQWAAAVTRSRHSTRSSILCFVSDPISLSIKSLSFSLPPLSFSCSIAHRQWPHCLSYSLSSSSLPLLMFIVSLHFPFPFLLLTLPAIWFCWNRVFYGMYLLVALNAWSVLEPWKSIFLFVCLCGSLWSFQNVASSFLHLY